MAVSFSVGTVVFLLVAVSVISAWSGQQGQRVSVEDVQPEQIHIAYSSTPTEVVVTWSTRNATSVSRVEYGSMSLSLKSTGNATKFTDGGLEKRTQYIHRVVLGELKPGKRYMYHCGSPVEGWSDVFWFVAMHDGTNWSPRFAVYGDLGTTNAQSLTRLQSEAEKGHFDAILHVGDFAYDFFNKNGEVGDAFMRQIQPIAAYVPYMVCVGNHEVAYNFSHYVNRFTMPSFALSRNLFYSWNIGPVHIISLNTEVYYWLDSLGTSRLFTQYNWLKSDLKQAVADRAKRPWIITIAHRPMYCSNKNVDCSENESLVRKGIPEIGAPGLENILYKSGVDLSIWAHQHSYERLWPVYDRTVFNGSRSHPYTDPGAPVHIVTGSAGCKEGRKKFGPPGVWSAFRSNDYGYTRMTVHNNTHLYMEQVSDDQDGVVIDRMWLIKHTHGPEAWRKSTRNEF